MHILAFWFKERLARFLWFHPFLHRPPKKCFSLWAVYIMLYWVCSSFCVCVCVAGGRGACASHNWLWEEKSLKKTSIHNYLYRMLLLTTENLLLQFTWKPIILFNRALRPSGTHQSLSRFFFLIIQQTCSPGSGIAYNPKSHVPCINFSFN